MRTILKTKFFIRYLPMFLSLVVVLTSVFVYMVVRDTTPEAEAGWYATGGTWTNRKPITIDYTKVARPMAKVMFNTATSTATWVVPTGVTSVTVKAWGGGGAAGTVDSFAGGTGGGGGFVQSVISVSASESLTVMVGGGGTGGSSTGGGAGGFSAVKRSSTYLTVAGGGGGGGGGGTRAVGGNGGAGGGSSGVAGGSTSAAAGGGAGTPSAGGAAGGAGAAGTQYTGGAGATTGGSTGGLNNGGAGGTGLDGGGGGGAGWWGGGGAGADATGRDGGAGGGGGSSSSTGASIVLTAGSGTTPGNNSDTDYSGTIGVGASSSGASGNAGAIVIAYPDVSDLSNFPMLLSVTDPDLKYTGSGGYVGKTDGTDILFTSSDGTTKLDHEIERYSSTTGETIAWIRIPTLSVSADTPIYIYFGNAGASDQQNAAGVWDSNYKGVYHLPNGTTLSAADSTGVNTSTVTAATATAGQVDGAASFNGTTAKIDLGNNAALSITTNTLTLEAWVKRNASNSTGYIIEKGVAGTSGYSLGLGTNTCTTNQVDITKNGVATTCSGTFPADTNWHHLAVSWGTYGASVFVDGVFSGGSGNRSNFLSSANNPFIGSNSAGASFFTGSIDEAKISNTNRSAGWIGTHYNNMYSPSTFYAYGALGIQNRAANTAAEKVRGGGSAGPAVKVRGGVKFR